jgi:hypothetical protein
MELEMSMKAKFFVEWLKQGGIGQGNARALSLRLWLMSILLFQFQINMYCLIIPSLSLFKGESVSRDKRCL